MNNRVKELLRPIVKQLHLDEIEQNVPYYISKILKLKSKAKVIDIEDIKKSRHKDIIFIMGSGYSINDITREEWQHIVDVGDTLSFNYFFKGKFVPINYHICGEVSSTSNCRLTLVDSKLQKDIKSYYDELFSNSYYKNTIYFLRYNADYIKLPYPNAIWALFFLKAFKNKQVCPYRIVTPKNAILEPSDDIYAIVHGKATLFDAINISYVLGYKKIVLVGVDLYDNRCFWLERNETREGELKRGRTYSDTHNTADIVMRGIDIWNKYLTKKGVRIYIYNPRSLLNKILPVYCNAKNGKRKD